MKLTLIITLLLLTCAGFSCGPDMTCAVIHEPKNGCPAGYLKEPKPRFTEKDGSKEFACINTNKPQCIDMLKSGEGMSMEIELQAKPPEESPKI